MQDLIQKLFKGVANTSEITLIEKFVTNHITISKAEGQSHEEVDHIVIKLKETKKP